MITYASITVQSDAVIYGQALAGTSATFAKSNTVTNPNTSAV
jgi:hypothetical protein